MVERKCGGNGSGGNEIHVNRGWLAILQTSVGTMEE